MGFWKSVREVLNNRIEHDQPTVVRGETASEVVVQRVLTEHPTSQGTRESLYLPSELWEELLQVRDGAFPLALNFGHGFLMERTTGKFVNVGNRHLRALGIWSCRVRGDNHHHGEVWPGRKITLVREPDNPHDKNAIALYNEHGERIGYWNRGMAVGLSKVLDTGSTLEALALGNQPPKVLAASPAVMAELLA